MVRSASIRAPSRWSGSAMESAEERRAISSGIERWVRVSIAMGGSSGGSMVVVL